MKIIKIMLSVIILTGLSEFLFCQSEVISDLMSNPYIKKQSKLQNRSSSILYQVDTLVLPFIEDFSMNRLKQYNAQNDDSNLVQVIWMHYKYNSVYLDTLKLSFSTTYSYDYNFNTQQYDSFPNAQVQIEIFSPVFPFNLDTAFNAWPASSIYSLGDIIKTVELPADTVLINQIDTFLVVPDDGFSYWVDNNVYINNRYAIAPPTFGVATFDGLDSTGYPYNFGMSQGSNGQADVLTSKPFQLDQMMNNVYLSFFYQPQGNGNAPEAKDSLVLEFYAPSENKWIWRWSSAGEASKDFSEVYILVDQSRFLQPGFRIRFRNYATLSGALDHWNIDYIRMDENRSLNDEIDDIAFQYDPPSFLKTYTAIPWRHYSSSQMAISNTEELNNLSLSAKFVTNAFSVFDKNNSLLFTSTPITNGSAAAASPFSMQHSLTYSFPTITSKDKFIIVHATNTTPDVNRGNDTIIQNQVFDTYYSYDDGSSEKGYALVGAGAKLAYKFSFLQKDTLTGILMYFPPMLENVSLRSFKLTVWNQNSGLPGDIIYQSKLYNPMYTNGMNNFHYYEINDTTLVLNGTYYVGWEQILADKIYVGFDVNIDNSDKIWYNTSGVWNNTSFSGSIMLRPSFGISEEFPIYISQDNRNTQDIKIYPNPASDVLNVEFDGYKADILLEDMQGKVLMHKKATQKCQLSIINLPEGVYFVHITINDNIPVIRKLIIY